MHTEIQKWDEFHNIKCKVLWCRCDREKSETFVVRHYSPKGKILLGWCRWKSYKPPCSLQTYFPSLQDVVWLGKNQQPDMPWWRSLLASTAVFNTGLNLLCTSFLYPLLLLSNASYVGGEEYLFALEMLLLFSWSVSFTLYLSYYTDKIILPVSHPFSASF